MMQVYFSIYYEIYTKLKILAKCKDSLRNETTRGKKTL